MNCKPGDLAVVVSPDEVTGDELLGRIVRVTTLHHGGEHWNYEGPRIKTVWGDVTALLDQVLRPIRDDDGDDESFQWVPKPEQVTA